MVLLRNFLLPDPQLLQTRHDLHRLQADADHLADQLPDLLWVVGAVVVVDDAAAPVRLDAVLVNEPFERGAVAEGIVIVAPPAYCSAAKSRI